MDDELFKRIQQFVVSERGKYRFPLTPETTLEGDLYITGDDADEFIIAFGKEFNVGIVGFDIGKYFGSEGGLMLPPFRKYPTPGKLPVTLGDLYNAVLTGRLI